MGLLTASVATFLGAPESDRKGVIHADGGAGPSVRPPPELAPPSLLASPGAHPSRVTSKDQLVVSSSKFSDLLLSMPPRGSVADVLAPKGQLAHTLRLTPSQCRAGQQILDDFWLTIQKDQTARAEFVHADGEEYIRVPSMPDVAESRFSQLADSLAGICGDTSAQVILARARRTLELAYVGERELQVAILSRETEGGSVVESETIQWIEPDGSGRGLTMTHGDTLIWRHLLELGDSLR